MEFLQIIVGGMFSMLGAGTIVFIAYRLHMIGAEVSEFKEILKDIRRNTLGGSPSVAAAPAARPAALREPGDWPSVTDPAYGAELPYALRPSPQDTEVSSAPAKKLWS